MAKKDRVKKKPLYGRRSDEWRQKGPSKLPEINKAFFLGRVALGPDIYYGPTAFTVQFIVRSEFQPSVRLNSDKKITRVLCKAYAGVGTWIMENLKKGMPVYVEGVLDTFEKRDHRIFRYQTQLQVLYAERLLDYRDRKLAEKRQKIVDASRAFDEWMKEYEQSQNHSA